MIVTIVAYTVPAAGPSIFRSIFLPSTLKAVRWIAATAPVSMERIAATMQG